jgi:hypothetical protein
MKNIKKILILVAVVSFTGTLGFTQDLFTDSRDKIQIGVKAGANLSNVYDTEDEDFTADPKLGFAGGVFAAIPIGTFLGVQPELLFSQKGYKGSGSILGSEYKYSRTSNFIDVPLLLAIKPFSTLTILAGPQFSFLLKETYRIENDIINVDEEQVFENDNIRKNTLCLVGGVDINLSSLVIGARVGCDLQNNNGDGTSTTPRYKNIWYQATIGYRLFAN